MTLSGIVHAYGEVISTVRMANPEKAGILEAVYAAGNKAGMPPGSGYYIVGLNAGQCAAKKAGAYGCKFDANGNPIRFWLFQTEGRPGFNRK